MEAITYDFLHLSNPHIHQFLQSISSMSPVSAFIIDFFCFAALLVATGLNILVYFFFISGDNYLDTFLYLSTLHRSTTMSFKDMDEHKVLHIPDVPLTPALDIVLPLLDRMTPEYASFLKMAIQLPKISQNPNQHFQFPRKQSPENYFKKKPAFLMAVLRQLLLPELIRLLAGFSYWNTPRKMWRKSCWRRSRWW